MGCGSSTSGGHSSSAVSSVAPTGSGSSSHTEHNNGSASTTCQLTITSKDMDGEYDKKVEKNTSNIQITQQDNQHAHTSSKQHTPNTHTPPHSHPHSHLHLATHVSSDDDKHHLTSTVIGVTTPTATTTSIHTRTEQLHTTHKMLSPTHADPLMENMSSNSISHSHSNNMQ
jgi:hypothetical protein